MPKDGAALPGGDAPPMLFAGLEAPVAIAVPAATASFCVLASSSSGNCSVLIHGEGRLRRVTLIDCGLSPRRTRLLLADLGLGLEHIDDVLLTHLDTDHFYSTWVRLLPAHARFRIHRRHRGRAERCGLLTRRTLLFGADSFEIADGVAVTPTLLSHDDLGVASFRFRWPGSGASLGYATDIGRITNGLITSLAGVDVLAIESNYCPRLQEISPRPRRLKDRIMGGSGHLSNEQCALAVRDIRPTRQVVLLHLSRECNTPDLAASYHADAGYALAVAAPDQPTPTIRV